MFPRLPFLRLPLAWLPGRRLPFGVVTAVLAAAALGCADTPSPTDASAAGAGAAPSSAAPGGSPAAAAPAADPHPQLELMARRLARALRDPAFRAYVRSALDESPFVEHKLPLQRFLEADGGRGRRELARANDVAEAALAADAQATIPLEMYFPVPAHRAAWSGGTDLLVATAVSDHDAPVAYDLEGRRHVLSPTEPPATPVLAVEPVETDFDRPSARRPDRGGPAAATCVEDCLPTPPPPPPPVTAGLYMTLSHLTETFESWLKGSPEIEILVLGQKGATDSLTRYQCIGERAAAPYYFDQDSQDWQGTVMLFSQPQLDAYKTQHPGQSVRLFFMEDDDTSCEIRNDPLTLAKLIGQVDAITRGFSGGRDSTVASSGILQKIYQYAKTGQKIFAVIASLIKSNDDLIGNAVEDRTLGEFHPGYNWVLKGENGVTNGWINLQMR
ncbi:MAG TPA: hypothetical protein VFS40_08440 [Gemmatimonadales bacterium]|nr:hypothetical protein [Gemmatimonadales bacterium]